MGGSSLFRKPGSRMIRDPLDTRLGDLLEKCSSRCPCIVGIPWDWSTAGRPGARHAPQRLREHLYSLNPHGLECLCDLGDTNIAPGDPGVSFRRISEASVEALRTCRGVLFLGGDHSVTRYTVPQVLRTLGGRAGLLVFDAHLDLRILSEGLSSGTYLGELVEEMKESLEVVIVGVRRHSNPSYMFERAKALGVSYMEATDLEDLSRCVEKILKNISGADWIYVSVDADSLDPSQCPGSNSPSPAGLYVREISEILEKVSEAKRIVGGDIVEHVPSLDPGEICGRSLAYIAYKILEILSRA